MRSGRQRGFTYVAILAAVAAVGWGLAATGEAWSRSAQREKERELLWVGEQFRQAIALYYYRTPGAVKRYPESLVDLLEDKRHLSTQRYLRKIYVDPVSGKAEWGLVRAPGGGIMGVHSLSDAPPLKRGGFAQAMAGLEDATRYSQWRFVYEPWPVPAGMPREPGR